MVNTVFNNGWIPRNPLVLYRFTFPQCAVAGRRGRIIAADGVLDRPQLKMIQNVGGDFSTFYRTLMQEAFAKSAVNGLSKKERFRLEDKAN